MSENSESTRESEPTKITTRVAYPFRIKHPYHEDSETILFSDSLGLLLDEDDNGQHWRFFNPITGETLLSKDVVIPKY